MAWVAGSGTVGSNWTVRSWRFYSGAADAAARALRAAATPRGAIPVVFVTDLHGNVGMCKVAGAAARAVGASVVLNAGDTTWTGTRLEYPLLWAMARVLPDSVQMVICRGNHDSPHTDRQARAAGMVVLDGRIRQVAGLRILGDGDPRRSMAGQATVFTGPESLTDLGERLASVARAGHSGGAIDVLVVHDVVSARPALAAGLVPLALSGHMHKRVGPKRYGQGVFFQGSSSGRDIRESTAIGRLRADAELAVFYLDAASHQPVAYRILAVTPHARVRLGPLCAIASRPGQPS